MVAPSASAAAEAKPESFLVSPLLLFLMAADVAPAQSDKTAQSEKSVGSNGASRQVFLQPSSTQQCPSCS